MRAPYLTAEDRHRLWLSAKGDGKRSYLRNRGRKWNKVWFLNMIFQEQPVVITVLLLLVCAPWARSDGEKPEYARTTRKYIAERQGCPSWKTVCCMA